MRRWMVLAILALHCSKSSVAPHESVARASAASAQSTEPSPARSAEPSVLASAPAPSIASANDPCAAVAAKYDAARAAASGRCVSNADCACFSDLRLDGVMRVSDRATASKLESYVDEYHKRSCPTVCVQTAPPHVCSSRCEAGICR